MTSTDLGRGARLTTGIAGLVGVVVLGYFITFATLPDVTASDAPGAITAWLADPATASTALTALAVGALSYVLLLVFLGGIRRLVGMWDPDGIWPSVTGLALVLFLAGALVSDAFAWAVPLTRRTAPAMTVPPELVALLDRGWLVALVEAQLALGVAIGAATMAGLAARRRGVQVPRIVLGLGAVAAFAVVPLILMPDTSAVFLATNQLRLLWIVAVSIWLVARPGARTL
ncbi:hypothetical protein [Sphaerimonospora thailandensis]|nr:hypothetical protein [Sphaerimonospora thailandensis]